MITFLFFQMTDEDWQQEMSNWTATYAERDRNLRMTGLMVLIMGLMVVKRRRSLILKLKRGRKESRLHPYLMCGETTRVSERRTRIPVSS